MLTLYGDETETAIVQQSYLASQSSALVVLLKARKTKLVFKHPADLTMWRINSFSEYEIAPGSEMIVASEFQINLAIYYFAFLSEYCLTEFGGVVPSKLRNLFQKMKCSTVNKGYSMIVDPALIPTQCWSSAFLDAFHIIMHVMSDTERNAFLTKLDLRCQGWHMNMIKNPLLKCFVIYVRPDGTLANRDFNSSKAFLECIRHILSHPLDYLQLMIRLGLGPYTKEDLHLLLQEKGGDKLLSDICDLLTKERLKELALERYLCREGSSCCPLPTACIRRKFKDEPCTLDPITVIRLQWVYDQRIRCEVLFVEHRPVLTTWKVVYASKEVSAVQGFWRMFSSLNNYSIWMCVREDKLGDCKSHEALNIICGLLQKMSACKNYSFGKMLILGTANGPFTMKGCWVFPGVEVPRFLMDLNGMKCYKWRRVDISVEKERDLIISVLYENPLDAESVVAARCL